MNLIHYRSHISYWTILITCLLFPAECSVGVTSRISVSGPFYFGVVHPSLTSDPRWRELLQQYNTHLSDTEPIGLTGFTGCIRCVYGSDELFWINARLWYCYTFTWIIYYMENSTMDTKLSYLSWDHFYVFLWALPYFRDDFFTAWTCHTVMSMLKLSESFRFSNTIL